jgi:hypothetical protein
VSKSGGQKEKVKVFCMKWNNENLLNLFQKGSGDGENRFDWGNCVSVRKHLN